ncbi:MAG: FAD-dependent monooxygenase [Phycisphaerales bacterium]|nr:FAD-dependent monooxygenase [Phycisphaerales bacterium]
MRVGIIGCGTGGQAAAILLARRGHTVTVFERAPRLDPLGAGLLLQPPGLTVLRELNVLDVLRELGTPVHDLVGHTAGGRMVMDLAYGHLHPGLHGLGLQRAAISAALLDRMHEAQVELHLDTQIVDVRADDAPARVITSGGEVGPFDLVIAADGARSTIRGLRGDVRRDRPYRWGALWFIGDDPDGSYGTTLRQIYRGTRHMIGFLPSGRRALDEPRRVSLFWSLPLAGTDQLVKLDEWKGAVRRLTALADPLLEQIRDASQLIQAPYRDVVLRRSFRGRLVFIGDAAHAMSPQLGQGVNLALRDASVLARMIEREPTLDAALSAYERARRRHVRFYQFASRWLTPWFQSERDLLGLVRDAGFGPMCRVGPTRRQMLRSLAGIKTGVLTHDPLVWPP